MSDKVNAQEKIEQQETKEVSSSLNYVVGTAALGGLGLAYLACQYLNVPTEQFVPIIANNNPDVIGEMLLEVSGNLIGNAPHTLEQLYPYADVAVCGICHVVTDGNCPLC